MGRVFAFSYIDSSGQLMVKYNYDAYGNSKGHTDNSGIGLASINPFRYKGYYYDTETKMYHCKSRYYVPEWCRWLNGDSVGYLNPQDINGMNLFAYCSNNPVMGIDPTGNAIISILLVIAGVLAAGTINGISAIAGKEEDESILGAFVGGFIDRAVGSIAVVAGLATGGVVGLVITAFISFAGGFAGNVVSQKISYGDIQWIPALVQGAYSAFVNSIMYGGLHISHITKGITWIDRFQDSLKISSLGVGISSYFSYFSLPSVNKLRR